MRALVLLLALTLLLPAAAADVRDALKDPDEDADWDVGVVCVWGFADGCLVEAYECFQPYRPGFGITCP